MKRVHILRGKLVRASRDNVLYCMCSLGLYYVTNFELEVAFIILWLFSFLYQSSIMHITRRNVTVDFLKSLLPPLGFLKRIQRWSDEAGLGHAVKSFSKSCRRIPKLNAYILVRFYIHVHLAIYYNIKKKIYVQKIFWELNATFLLVVSLN